MKKFLCIAVTVLCFFSNAYGTEVENFGRAFFIPECRFSDTGYLKGKGQGAENAFYYDISQLHPGQTTYSIINMKEKIVKAIDKGYAKENKKGEFVLKNDGGRAVYPLEMAFPVANTPWGLILMNGHHRSIASMKMGATTIPVQIIVDVTDITDINQLKAKLATVAFPVDARGNTVRMPCYLDQLTDDPDRYFAKLSSYQGKHSRTKYPLWIPVGKHFGGQEAAIAQLLNQFNLIYQNDWGPNIPPNFLNAARVLLTNNSARVEKVCTVSPEMSVKKITNKIEDTELTEICPWIQGKPSINSDDLD